MRTETIDSKQLDKIVAAADAGGYLDAAVTLLTPNLNKTDNARDAGYLVVTSYYNASVIRLGAAGQPVAHLIDGE